MLIEAEYSSCSPWVDPIRAVSVVVCPINVAGGVAIGVPGAEGACEGIRGFTVCMASTRCEGSSSEGGSCSERDDDCPKGV